MFDFSLACSSVASVCRSTDKVAGMVPWTPSDVLPDLVGFMPKQVASDELHFVLGKDRDGYYVYDGLERMPHLLVAGTTGSGKSVFLNGLLASLLLRHTPSTLSLTIVDPKMVEFSCYRSLPHLFSPVCFEVESAVSAVEGLVDVMEDRLYRMMQVGAKDLSSYNALVKDPLARHVVVIDEFADIILGAVTKEQKALVKRFELGLTRLAQKARAAGIHLILATQKPTVQVVTSVLRSNIPARVALKVSTAGDSRVIMDEKGAEELAGKGDLYFRSPTQSHAKRLQGVWVSDHDIMSVIKGG